MTSLNLMSLMTINGPVVDVHPKW